MEELLKKAVQMHELTREEIISLLKNHKSDEVLFACADEVRKDFVGDVVRLYGLIEFSNFCKNNCCYCGLRRGNKNIERHRMEIEEIYHAAKATAELWHLKTLVMQSGEDMGFSDEQLCKLIADVKKLGVDLVLSNGEKSLETYQAYKRAGVDGFLMRIETTDKKLYDALHPGDLWEKRANSIENLARAGLQVATGFLVGLPNQTLESIADDILFCVKSKPALVGVGPFIPHKDTPLRGAVGGTLITSLKVTAILRLLLPSVQIPATTAMEALEKSGQEKALNVGANVVMPVVPTSMHQCYDLFKGKTETNYSADLKPIYQMVKKIGRYCE